MRSRSTSHTASSTYAERLSERSSIGLIVECRAVMPDRLWITVRDGTRLAADVYLPGGAARQCPTLLEALPYRKDDLTSSSHLDDYVRLVAEGDFAVCR